jgi:hypothetical protein
MDARTVRKTGTLIPNSISIEGQYLLALEWDCSSDFPKEMSREQLMMALNSVNRWDLKKALYLVLSMVRFVPRELQPHSVELETAAT